MRAEILSILLILRANWEGLFGTEEKSAMPNDDFFRRYAKMPTHDVAKAT